MASGRHDPDVLVIGGGIVGLFCAYHLRRGGSAVAVLERGPVGGPQSCSSRNTGFVGTQGAAPLAEPGVLRGLLNPGSPVYVKPRLDGELLRWLWHFRRACNEQDAKAGFRVLLDLKKRSLEILRELSPATFKAPGMVLAFKTAEQFDKACRSVPDGVPLRVLGDGELRELEPDVEFDIRGALYNEEGAHLDVPDFLREFSGVLESMGVEIHAETEAVGFEIADGRIRQVRTIGGDFQPGEVVIAAGTWSAECARKLDVGLELQPAKGYTVTVKTPPNAPRLPVILSEGRVAVSPLGDRFRFGGTLELSGMNGRNGSISHRRVDRILQTVQAYLPKLEYAEPLEIWSGFRPCTPDSLPFIGRAGSYRNLSIACGHGHIGMGLAPAGGKLIAQIVAGERPDVDVAPFRVGRFGEGRRR